jgi:hypothetical protein
VTAPKNRNRGLVQVDFLVRFELHQVHTSVLAGAAGLA